MHASVHETVEARSPAATARRGSWIVVAIPVVLGCVLAGCGTDDEACVDADGDGVCDVSCTSDCGDMPAGDPMDEPPDEPSGPQLGLDDCQSPVDTGFESRQSYILTLDNFVAKTNMIVTRLCWWGGSIEPSLADDFRVTYYTQVAGLPGEVIRSFVQSEGQLNVTSLEETPAAELTFEPESLDAAVNTPLRRYEATHDGVALTGGTKVWIEISNNHVWGWANSADGDTQSAYAFVSGGSANQFQIHDPGVSETSALPGNQAFCLKADISALVGACCDVPGRMCFDATTEAACEGQGLSFQGVGTSCTANPCPLPPPTGACCIGGACEAALTQAACAMMAGVYQGDDVPCTMSLCQMDPTGACCDAFGQCTDDVGQFDCLGHWLGQSTQCAFSFCTPFGACCLGTSCTTLTSADCVGQGGTYVGDGTNCSTLPCALTTGACCHTDGACDDLAEENCTLAGDTFHGTGTECNQQFCPVTSAACCLPDGTCVDVPPPHDQCTAMGGLHAGAGSRCAVINCAPFGACCLGQVGSCLSQVTENECAVHGGLYRGDGTVCETACNEPIGACCDAFGQCVDQVTMADCLIDGLHDWQGHGTRCQFSLCTPFGACCFLDGTCGDAYLEELCVGLGGQYQGDGSQCEPAGPPCP